MGLHPEVAVKHLLAGIAAALLCGSALAQPQPGKRVVLVVPAVPGGGLDAIARALSKRLGDEWGVPVIVETQPGAEGLIGTQRVAAATPDGTTLLLQIPSLILLKYTHKDLTFDPVAALIPVSELGRTPSAISVNAKLPVHSVTELAAYCRQASPPCSWGSAQQLSYLSGKRIFSLTGIQSPLNVPYKGTAAVITDLIGGHITIGITSVASPLPYHRSGSVRILAVNAEKRFAQIPDVPTFREAGIQMPARGSWYGLFAPRGTPPDAIARIEKGVMTAATDKWVRQSVEALGGEPVFGTQRDFAAIVREEETYLAALVKQFPLE